MNDPLSSPSDKREMLARLILGKHRKNFPTLDHATYFNYGAQGLLPQPALVAIQAAYQRLIEEAPFTLENNLAIMKTKQDLRGVLGAELGVPGTCLSLIESTSVGCNIALWSIPWRAGDRILLSGSEYPGVLATVAVLRKRYGLQVDTFQTADDDESLLANLAAQLSPQTRMVVLSHVLWDTGKILPLQRMAQLCRERAGDEVRILVDGAQSVGVLPLSLAELDVDFYAFTGHKWLCGPEGVGALYVHPRAFETMALSFVGWGGIDTRQGMSPERLWPDGRRLEVGTSATPLYEGLRAALELHRQYGTAQARFNRIRQLSARLHRSLLELADRGLPIKVLQAQAPEVGLVYFHGGDNPRLVRTLESERILLRTVPVRDCVRASVHYLTQEEEIERLIAGLSRYYATQTP